MQWERDAGRWNVYGGTYADYLTEMANQLGVSTYTPAYNTNPDATTNVKAYISTIWEESIWVSVVYDATNWNLLAYSLDMKAGNDLHQNANELSLSEPTRPINKAVIIPCLIKIADIYRASEKAFFVLGGCQREENIYVISENGNLQFRMVGLPIQSWLGIGIKST
ncbi:hypothetical protein [Hydrogenobacter thermophilus]|uniref:hypothetical protein n=1 Tax=Hydrogenobacter thermophilus TaxID=940 RepID=UPI0030F554C1